MKMELSVKMQDNEKQTEVSEDEEVLYQKMADIVAHNPFACYIGMELMEITKGYARARIQLKPQFENVYGWMHGGCAFTLADTLAGVAASVYGGHVSTLDASMNYMRPVSDTEYLYCEAKVQRSGHKISVVRTELMDDGGKLLIDGSFTYYHLGKN